MLFYWPFREFSISAFLLDITLLKPLYHNGWYLSYLLLWYVVFYCVRRVKVLDEYRIFILTIISALLFFTQREIRAEQSLSFLTGILLSEYKDSHDKMFRVRNGIGLITFGVFFLALKQLPVVRSAPQIVMNTVQLFIKLPVGLGLMILVFCIGKHINLTWLKWIGMISYELYLVHGYVLNCVPVTMVGAATFFSITVVASFILWFILNKMKGLQKKLLHTNQSRIKSG